MGVLVKVLKDTNKGGVRGKIGVWHRGRKDTDGSAGERNNTKITWGTKGNTGV